MPAAIPIVAAAGVGGGISAAATGAGLAGGALFAATVGASLASAATAYGASRVLGLNDKNSSVDNLYSGVRVNPGKADEPIPIVYGEMRVSGPLAFRKTIDDENKLLWVVPCWSEGEIESIEEHYLDNRKLSGILEGDDAENIKEVRVHLGELNQQADSTMVSEIPDWTTAHRLRGIAYTGLKLKYNKNGPNAFKNGFPQMSALIKGIKCFDPRTGEDEWTNNPALILLDYLTNSIYGRGVPYSNIDEPAFIAAANYCEEKVTYPNGNKYQRYTCNLALDPKQTIRQNVLAIASTCRGWPIYTGGMWTLVLDKPEEYTSLRLTDDIMIGDWTVELGKKANRYNRVRVSYIDSRRKYEPNQVIVKSDAMLAEDGGIENEWQLALPGTVTKREAKRIASQELKQARQSTFITGRCTLAALAYSVGDVVPVDSALNGWDGKPFRFTKMDLANDDTVGIEAVEYDPSVHTLDVDDEDDIPDTNLPDPFKRPIPKNIILRAGTEELLISGSGDIISRLFVSWNYAGDKGISVERTNVRWKATYDSEDKWIYTYTDDLNLYLQPVSDGQRYDVQLQSVNFAQLESAWTSVESVLIEGKSVLPRTPFGFYVNPEPDGRKSYVWDDGERDKDWRGWRIYYGSTNAFGSAIRLHDGVVTDSPYIASLPYAGVWYFWLVQVDTSNNESLPRPIGPIDLTGVQIGNALFQADARALSWPGTTDGINRNGQLVATDTGTWADLGATRWLDWDFWGVSPAASFVYTHTTVDLGASQTVTPLAFPGGSDDLTAEVRDSANGTAWNAWVAPGVEVTNRFFEFRVTVATTASPIAHLNSFLMMLVE